MYSRQKLMQKTLTKGRFFFFYYSEEPRVNQVYHKSFNQESGMQTEFDTDNLNKAKPSDFNIDAIHKSKKSDALNLLQLVSLKRIKRFTLIDSLQRPECLESGYLCKGQAIQGDEYFNNFGKKLIWFTQNWDNGTHEKLRKTW